MLRKMRHDWKAIMWRPFWLVVYFVSVSCMSQLPSINTSLPETPLQPSPPPPPPPPPLPDMSLCEIYLQSPDQNFASQMPWFCMCSTCTHKKGEKGARGDRGIQGNPGLSGPKGPTGFGGPQGNVGMQGIKGEKGDSGDKGDFGLVGPMGSKGEQGIKGAKGDPGINGPIGDPGPKGDPGQCPQVRDIFQGPPGETGLPGPVGAPGLPGQNGQPGPRGLKGDQGVIGAPGIPGVMGQKGEHGIEGNCNCQNGTKGDTGLEGSKGNKGDVGVAGQQGNEGQKGQKGEQGDMGMMGIPGPCTPIVQSAFSVALTGSFPPPSQPVSFLKVIYNLQQHYNPTAGIYTAPINGTYVFSYNLVASTRALKVGLFWNFLPVVKTTQMMDLGTTSQQVVLHLSMGDWVWLQVRDSNSNGMFTNSEASSTFSGYLLNPDSCDMIMSREVSNPVIPDTFPWDDS